MAEPSLDIAAALAGRDALLRDACDRALRYLGTLADRPVAPDPAATAALDGLDFPLPAHGLPAPDVLRMLDETGSPATRGERGPAVLRLRHRRRAAGGAGRRLAERGMGSERRAGRDVAGRGAPRRSRPALGNRAHRPARPAPRAVSSPAPPWPTSPAWPRPGTRCCPGTAGTRPSRVCSGAPPLTVVVGAEVHTTVRKALGLLGLGRNRAVVLPADGQGRIARATCPH